MFRRALRDVKDCVVICAIIALMASSCEEKKSAEELTAEVVRLQAVVHTVGEDVALATCESRDPSFKIEEAATE